MNVMIYLSSLAFFYFRAYKTKKQFTDQFETPYYLQNLEFSETDLLDFKVELTDELLTQFGYECLDKNAKFGVIEQSETNALKLAVEIKRAEPEFKKIFGLEQVKAIAADIGVPVGSLSHYVNNFWGGYYSALDLFLKPVVEELIKKGYDRKYIAAALGGEDNRAKAYKYGHYRLTSATLTRYCLERWWTDCNNWGDVQEKFLKDIFESLVIKGYSYEMMVEELEAFHDRQQIKYRMVKLFKDDTSSGLRAARRILLKPLLENLLPKFTDAEIIEKLNLKDWLPFGSSNNRITDEIRLLNYLVEDIWLHKYMTLKKGRNYDLRVQILYSGNQASDIVRLFLKTGFLKFLS